MENRLRYDRQIRANNKGCIAAAGKVSVSCRLPLERSFQRMMNQNACLASCEDVLAALPTRATRDPMNGNHTALFNPGTAGGPIWVGRHQP
jgi:hypothetical protein